MRASGSASDSCASRDRRAARWPKRAVVAVAAVQRKPGTDEIAESLARYRADHGGRTVLAHADGMPAPLDAAEGDIESVPSDGCSRRRSRAGERARRIQSRIPKDRGHGPPGTEHLGKLVASARGTAPTRRESDRRRIGVGRSRYTVLRRRRSHPAGRRGKLFCGIPSWPPGTRWSGSGCPCPGRHRRVAETALSLSRAGMGSCVTGVGADAPESSCSDAISELADIAKSSMWSSY